MVALLPLAHAGHTLVNLVFALPAIAFVAWLAVVHVKDRRARARGQQGGGSL